MSLQSSGLPAGLKHGDIRDAVNRPLLLEPEFLTEDEARRRREQLNRRPSYRMILKDLETVGDKTLKKEIDETTMDRVALPSPVTINTLANNPLYVPSATNGTSVHTRPSPANEHDAATVVNNVFSPRLTELPVVATASDASSSIRAPQPIVVNPNDLLGIKPVSDAVARATTAAASFINTDWSSNLLNVYNSNTTSPMGSVSGLSGSRSGMPENDESNRKRQVRLLKNREAAKECRRKKKEYVKCLENRVAVLENQNKALIEELKTLKELYCRKEKAELSRFTFLFFTSMKASYQSSSNFCGFKILKQGVLYSSNSTKIHDL
uniref:BZIP domain-containing protein n=1 Tax=Panagrolaimus sp. JU765 TaxID=591449 RepID=A0AC34Q8W1_9BILA